MTVWILWVDHGVPFDHEWDVAGVYATEEAASAAGENQSDDVSVEPFEVLS